jgi:hypothetical protein
VPYPEKLIRKIPEAPRKRTLTVKPKATRQCIWQRIARAEARMIGLAMAASKEAR